MLFRSFDKGRITGVTRIENDEVLLILDLESVVKDLGIYTDKMEFDESTIERFSGVALTLDDSVTARKRVKTMLQKMGLQVVEAKDGAEGLEKLEELYRIYGGKLTESLKIIVSDVEMPKMDGFHFAQNVKQDERFRGIPIVFNSSLSNEFMTEKGMKESGGSGYLIKFDANNFYSEIARVIREHKR